ncbi:uncharacterized protein LOC114294020 [Camellia sinensis]|uniref:uncharacterized protein LOC114294020 n=1 Tax=Camellia sinensis TaxID=4442 RepID=UPI0010365394|nr:uncharacterized protein LOC114294020 [Camellia sinensis]
MDLNNSSSQISVWDKAAAASSSGSSGVKHARMTSSMIGGLISSDIRNKTLTSVNEVVCDFKDYYGTEVSYRRVWMGVEKARGLVFGDYSSSFDDLRWYVDAANDCNPYCRPVLMLDGTFLKRRHKGCLLATMAKNGNKGLYPLYFAIVDSENYDSWHWFLSKLFVILTPGRDIAFDIGRYGVKSRESKEYLLTLFSRCAYAPTIELFNELFEEFKGRCGRSVQKFLEDLPNECWCNTYFQGRRYEKKLEEAFNNIKTWIVKKCSDDIYEIQLDRSVMVDIGKRSCSC